MKIPPPLTRFRWPLVLTGALGLAVGGGMLVGSHTADGINPFYANVAAADAERLARIAANDPLVDAPDPVLIDNSMPPVAPVDLSFARATRTVGNEAEADTGP